MNSMISCSRLLAAAMCGVVLAGCNAVEDVRDEPFTAIPTQEVVLEGTINGLGSRRSLVLLNNGEITRSFLASPPIAPATPPTNTPTPIASKSLFAFGNVKLGSQYNITVKQQPFGKICTVNNPSGVMTAEGASPAITIDCVNNPAVPRYSVTVSVPNAFITLLGAKVTLTTEEAVREVAATAAVPSTEAGFSLVTFPSALFTNPAGSAVFDYTVSASTLEGGATRESPNRCGVTNAINPTGGSPAAPLPPTANVGVAPQASTAWPKVQPCTFTIGGNIGAAAPPVGAYTATAITGLVLQLRDRTGAPLETLPIPTFTPAAPALPTAATGANAQGYTFAYPTRSNINGVYEVAVQTHPAGQFCIVTGAALTGSSPSAGGVSLYQTSRTIIPANVTNMNVRCRALPATANQLKGTYFVTSGDRFLRATANAGTPPVATTTDTTVRYRQTTPPECPTQGQFNLTITRNVTTGAAPTNACDYNNFRVMITFFKDGTFLLATHGATNSIEHGFYSYDPITTPADKKLYITLITDTGGTTTANPVNGFGSFPGSVVNPASSYTHQVMYNVVTTPTIPPTVPADPAHPRGTAATLSGRFGALPSDTTFAAWATMTMTEAFSIPTQMTGSWVTEDHRRVWNYDYNSTYGYHVGVNGGATNLQEACYTLADYTSPSGFYTRRGSITGCYPVSVFGAGAGTIDLPSTTAGLPTLLTLLPGFIGRMPGSETAFDGRATSPIYYHIAPPASFYAGADPTYFPTTSLSWCTTEVLAVRASLNQVPIPDNPPVYFCRQTVD